MKGITKLPLFKQENGIKNFDFNNIIPMPNSLNIDTDAIGESILYYLTERCVVPLEFLDVEKTKNSKVSN